VLYVVDVRYGVIYGKKKHAFNKPFLAKEYALLMFITIRIIRIKFS
jgi:hypothetical protein